MKSHRPILIIHQDSPIGGFLSIAKPTRKISKSDTPWRIEAPFFPDPASKVAPREVKSPKAPATCSVLRMNGSISEMVVPQLLRHLVGIKELLRLNARGLGGCARISFLAKSGMKSLFRLNGKMICHERTQETQKSGFGAKRACGRRMSRRLLRKSPKSLSLRSLRSLAAKLPQESR